MVNFKEEIAKIIGQVLDGLTEDEIKDMVEVPQDDKMGDYAFPCFKLAKTLKGSAPYRSRHRGQDRRQSSV